MKFKIDDKEVFDLNETKKKVICNDISSGEIDEDLERRVKYIVEHKYERCMKRLKEEWEPKLKEAGVKSIPLDDDELAELIFGQDTYKDKKTRAEEELQG